MIILARTALKESIGDETDLQRRVEFVRNKTLMEKLLQNAAQTAITDDSVRKAYEDAVRTVGPQTEIRLRAIFFKFKDANDRASVRAAEARAKADSPFGKTNGGDLGFMTQPEMGKELADVAFALENGGVSAPIKTQLGWHMVKVEDKRQRKPVDFETVRDKFEAIVGRRAQQNLIAKLRSEARIQRLDTAADAKPAGEKSE